MALAVGTDIVEIQRVAKVLSRQGDLSVRRILCEAEQAEYQRLNQSAAFLSKRFAAKEATSKALGTGFKQGVAPRQIGVVHAPSGKPDLAVSGHVATLFEQHDIVASHVSLSDDGGFAIAYVVLEIAGKPV